MKRRCWNPEMPGEDQKKWFRILCSRQERFHTHILASIQHGERRTRDEGYTLVCEVYDCLFLEQWGPIPGKKLHFSDICVLELVTDLDTSIKTTTHKPSKPNILTLARNSYGSWALGSSSRIPVQAGDRCSMRNWKLIQLASLSHFEVPPRDKYVNEYQVSSKESYRYILPLSRPATACRGCQWLGEKTTLRTDVGWWTRIIDFVKSRKSYTNVHVSSYTSEFEAHPNTQISICRTCDAVMRDNLGHWHLVNWANVVFHSPFFT